MFENHMVVVPGILADVNLEQITPLQNEVNHTTDFLLIMLDGSEVTLTSEQFAQAFGVITHDEFAALCRKINRREDMDERRQSLFIDLDCKTEQIGYTELYELMYCSVSYGKYCERVKKQRNYLIDYFSWKTWINACRLYECMYQIPREYLG